MYRAIISFFSVLLVLMNLSSVEALPVENNSFKTVAYINSHTNDWLQYEQLFNGTFTHLIVTFLLPDSQGNISISDAAHSFNVSLIRKAQAAGTKVLIAVGGSTVGYRTYIDIAENPKSRRRFIRNLLNKINEGGYDGIDLNFEGWFEGMTISQRNKVNKLVKELAKTIKGASANKLVTLPIAPLYWITMSTSCELINSELIDFAQHMSYDFDAWTAGPNGPFRVTDRRQYLYPGYESTERSVWGAFRYLFNQGCSADKLVAGIPFYSTAKEPWQRIRTSGNWEEIALHPDYLEKLVPERRVWVTDPEAVRAKVQAYKDLGLAGVMVWQIGHEGPLGDLSKALYRAARQ